MKRSARCLMAGLTAVFLFLLLVTCTTPAEITETAAPPTTTPIPATATTAPTPEPTATPTLTAAQQRDERATAVLTTLPGYDPVQHEALLPLARALWGDEYRVDPADVAIVVGETALQITADAPYPSGTLFVWNADSQPQPFILTGQQDTTINRGQVAFGATTLDTWVRYDGDGNVLEFVDPAGNWISPLDLQEDGRFTFYTQEQIGPNGERQLAQTIWWANGRQPVELTTSPIPGQSLTDYLGDGSAYQLHPVTIDGQPYPGIVLVSADKFIHYYDAQANQWRETSLLATNLTEQVEQLYAQGVDLIHPSIQIPPTDTLPGFEYSAAERLRDDMEGLVAVITNEDVVRRGFQYVNATNSANNRQAIETLQPGASADHALYPAVNSDTGQITPTLVPHNATWAIYMESGFNPLSENLVPFYFGTAGATTRYGLHYNPDTNTLNVLVQLSTSHSTDAGVGSQPHALWGQVMGVFFGITKNISQFPSEGGSVNSITAAIPDIKSAFRDKESIQVDLDAILLFSDANYLNKWSQGVVDAFNEKWGNQAPANR